MFTRWRMQYMEREHAKHVLTTRFYSNYLLVLVAPILKTVRNLLQTFHLHTRWTVQCGSDNEWLYAHSKKLFVVLHEWPNCQNPASDHLFLTSKFYWQPVLSNNKFCLLVTSCPPADNFTIKSGVCNVNPGWFNIDWPMSLLSNIFQSCVIHPRKSWATTTVVKTTWHLRKTCKSSGYVSTGNNVNLVS